MIGGHWYVIIGLLIIVLIFYGPGRMSEIGGALGKGIHEFRKASSNLLSDNKTPERQGQAEPPPAETNKPADGPKP